MCVRECGFFCICVYKRLMFCFAYISFKDIVKNFMRERSQSLQNLLCVYNKSKIIYAVLLRTHVFAVKFYGLFFLLRHKQNLTTGFFPLLTKIM